MTDLGRKNVAISARKLSRKKIDLIFASPLFRTQETAEIVRETLGLPKNKLITEERIREIQTGVYNGRPVQEYRDFFSSIEEKMVKRPKDGENILDMKKRIAEFFYEIDAKYTNKNILIVTHEYGVWMSDAIAKGATTKKEVANLRGYEEDYINTSKFKSCDFVSLPHNENFELDLHRPYIDNIKLVGKDGEVLKRVPEVLDGWVDSGSVPFAEYH